MKPRWRSSLALCACLLIGSLSAVLADESRPGLPSGAPSASDPSPPIEEILLGNGSSGPYLLAWTHVLFATESVAVDGRHVQQGLEYTLDYATGKVQFFRPLAQGQVARVSYRYDHARARPNPGATRLPVDLKLWQGGAGSLQVGGLMAPASGVRQYNLNLIVGAPAAGSRLTLSCDVRGKTRADGGRDQVAVTRAQIEQKLGATTAAKALVERSQGAGGAAGARVDRTALTLTTRPSSRAQITGEYARSDSARTGADATTSLRLTTTPLARLKLNSQFSRRISEREGVSSALGFDWNARAGRRIGFDGAFSRTDAERIGTNDTQRLRLVLGPLSLEGQRKESDRLAGPGEEEELLRLEAAVVRGLRFGGGRGSRVAGADRATTALSEAFVEIAPARAFQVRGTLQSAVTGEQAAMTRALSAALKAPGLLELSGAYKAREPAIGDALISRDYVVALTPLRGLRLQGAYRENPEDKSGRVLDQSQTSLGVQSQLGSLGLSGTFSTIEAGPAAGNTTEQMELKLTLDLAAKTRFYSGYRERESRQSFLWRDRTFSLGFTRSVGSSLFLLLEGEYTLSDRDAQSLDDPTDARANARLGLRF